ncbi:MAG TPA: ATP-binding cassette domain-containing protein, partial [Baekduia sp.]|nr:ATP-binding cassette domain-containing protein [Baekduia sp.]
MPRIPRRSKNHDDGEEPRESSGLDGLFHRGDEAPSDEPATTEQPAHAEAADVRRSAWDEPDEGDAVPFDDEETREQAAASRAASRERVQVVTEPPRGGDPDDEYQWHSGLKRPHGMPDAVEFVDVHKAFGRNKILRGLNMGLPEGKISMILGPSGTGKSVCIKHMVGLLYPDEGDVIVHGESVPNMVDDDLFEMRKKFGVLFQDGALFGSMNLLDNVAFPLRQHTDKSEEEVLSIVRARLEEVGLGH